MDNIEEHRIAFGNIGSRIFRDLEDYFESALKKEVEKHAEQEKVIETLKSRLHGQDPQLGLYEKLESEHSKRVEDQKDEIHRLKCELAEAVVENANLEQLLSPKVKSDGGRRRRALGTPPRDLLQDKENLVPLPLVLNNLTSPLQKLPTLERAVSPPHRSPVQTSISLNPASDRAIQTDNTYSNDQATQTSPEQNQNDLTEAYRELSSRYDTVRNEALKLKNAYLGLQEKYLKNKKVWEAWVKTDKERIEQSKKRKREGTVLSEDGYTIIKTSYTKPPPLSPDKPSLMSELSHAIPIKKVLFEGSGCSIDKTGSEDLGVDISNSDGMKAIRKRLSLSAKRARLELTERDDITSPETPGAAAETLIGIDGRPTTTIAQHQSVSSVESEGGESRDFNNTSTQKLYDHPPVAPPRPDTAFNIPNARAETDSRYAQEDGSISHHVVIKSEPSASSTEGFGYHYEQESLDLDDIGHKPDTPRKRQRATKPLLKERSASSIASSGRPGWSNGGFTITRIPNAPQTQDPMMVEDTQDEDEGIMWNNDDESISPTSPSPNVHLVGAAHQPKKVQILSRMTSIERKAPAHKSSDTIIGAHDKGGRKIDQVGRNPSLVESINQPLLSSSVMRALPAEKKLRSGRGVPGGSKTKRRITPRGSASIVQITEGGTDGLDEVEADDISEEQRRLEGIPKPAGILHSPAPKTPSLVHLKKTAGTWNSAPSKKAPRAEFGNPESTSEPPNKKARRDWVGTIEHPRGKQKDTSRQSKLDISHFRVNPKVNDGRDYAFAETVRNHEARKCLPGCVKTCCKGLSGFVEAAGLPLPPPKGPRWRSSSPASTNVACEGEVTLDTKFTARFGRHRDAFPRQKSPPGFWDADFPNTQDLEKQHEAAEEMRLQKVEKMRREAEKGDKGRYIYKGR